MSLGPAPGAARPLVRRLVARPVRPPAAPTVIVLDDIEHGLRMTDACGRDESGTRRVLRRTLRHVVQELRERLPDGTLDLAPCRSVLGRLPDAARAAAGGRASSP